MKIEKNKVVFASLLLTILLFLIGYSMMIMDKGDSDATNLKDPQVPPLKKEIKEYKSKLEAVDDIREEREKSVPGIYNEKLVDSLGFYKGELATSQQELTIDSLYDASHQSYPYDDDYYDVETYSDVPIVVDSTDFINSQLQLVQERGIEHLLFFATHPPVSENLSKGDSILFAEVDGNQTVKVNSRLRMRLSRVAMVGGQRVEKNTLIFGFIRFRANRVIIEIENIDKDPAKLLAYDVEDFSEGIYVENSFRSEVTSEVSDDVLGQINIPSLPPVKGIASLLRHHNRNVKATILDKYQLILKIKP